MKNVPVKLDKNLLNRLDDYLKREENQELDRSKVIRIALRKFLTENLA